MILLVVATGTALFGHGREHLADVRGQEVVHLVALREREKEVIILHSDHW